MRKNIVAGNWKMNTSLEEGIALAQSVEQWVAQHPSNVRVIVAPPFTHLTKIREIVKNTGLSAQNCSSEVSGAYTGEVSVEM